MKWTVSNIITTLRVLLIPLWLGLAEVCQGSGVGEFFGLKLAPLFVFIFFLLISLTDKLDGYLARSRNEITTYGIFLDPIADKLLVLVALAFFCEVHMLNAWPLLIVAFREFLVSALRMVASAKGLVVPANKLGKYKTVTTLVAICMLLFSRSLTGDAHVIFFAISTLVLVVALVLTIWSGWVYVRHLLPYLGEDK